MTRCFSALITAIAISLPASSFAAEEKEALDYDRPDCSGYEKESDCIVDAANAYKRKSQQYLQGKGLAFWYMQRPDFKGNEDAKKAIGDKQEANVTIGFEVNPDGSTANVHVAEIKPEAGKVYGDVFLNTISGWEFMPIKESLSGLEFTFNMWFPKEKEAGSDGKDEDSSNAKESEGDNQE